MSAPESRDNGDAMRGKNESAFCDVCHVAYDPSYDGPCHEFAGHATDRQIVEHRAPMCPGTVSLHETVRMQRERAERAEGILRRWLQWTEEGEHSCPSSIYFEAKEALSR